MNIIDETAEAIRNASIGGIDLDFVESLSPAKAYEAIDTRPEYKEIIGRMTKLMEDGVAMGVPPERSAGAVLGVFEDIVRYVIGKTVRERLLALGADKLAAINTELGYQDVLKKVEDAHQAIAHLGAVYRQKAENAPLEQFKAYMLYANEKWAHTPEEKKVIETIVRRVGMGSVRAKRHAKVS